MPFPRAFPVAVLVLLLGVVCAAQSIQVTPLMRDDRVLVSFKLTDDIFTDEVRAAIHSGVTITFVYDVQLRRSATLWLDRTISASTVIATVRYDTLTRRYIVTRKADGRMVGGGGAEALEREEAAREWLTQFERLPLFSTRPLEPNAEYYVRVRAHTTPRNASFLWPWGGDIAGLAKFTFLK
ncbi:MAG TPA: DUF4390 domain-containing protein [Vicinamibacterales bacterium]|nr:DUF4390 domain-containing protein [Vicinamibacterales bacterium]